MVPKINLIHGRDNQNYYFARLSDELVRYSRIRLFMMDAQLYYNGANVQYKVHKEELLILMSLVDKDGTYFDDIVPFRTHPNIHNLTYDTAHPRTSHVAYNHAISMEEQINKTDKTDDDGVTEDENENENADDEEVGDNHTITAATATTATLPLNPRMGQEKMIPGNRSTSFWVFPQEAMEITFNENSNMAAMQYILDKHGFSFSSKFICETIANSMYVNMYPEKLIHLWNKQGKLQLMRKVVISDKVRSL